jgi:hypothetical protein
VEKNLKLHIYNTGDHAEIQHWGVFKDDVLYVKWPGWDVSNQHGCHH